MSKKEKTIRKTLTKAAKLGVGGKFFERGTVYEFTESEWAKIPEKSKDLFESASNSIEDSSDVKETAGTLTPEDGGV